MPGPRPADIIRHLAGPDPRTPDADLLRRFATGRDEAAFAELVRRHGPVVLAACRRMLGHHDADDAFQAVFLTLARRAGEVRNPDLLGNWLYRVAVRVAWRSRRTVARRRRREVQVSVIPDPPTFDSHSDDLWSLLDQELAGLPTAYREAIVLCHLRGVSRAEAAKALKIPQGTLSSRLAAGRQRLADRLTRRGVTLVAAVVPGVLSERPAVAVPESLVSNTCAIVADWLAGVRLPAPVLRFAQGGFPVRMMPLLLSVAAALVVGVVFAGQPGDEPRSQPPPAAVTEEKPTPEEPPVSYRFAQRPSRVADLRVKDVQQVMWSPDGGRLAVVGAETVEAPDRKGFPIAVIEPLFAPQAAPLTLELPKGGKLVGFVTTGTGPAVLTDLREYQLVSGLHRLESWGLNTDPFRPPGDAPNAGPLSGRFCLSSRSVDLDPVYTAGYALAADGTSFRTVYCDIRNKQPVQLEVREVSVESGRTVRTPLRVPGWAGVLDGRGNRLFVAGEVPGGKGGVTAKGDGPVSAYDVRSGKKLWAREFGPRGRMVLEPSPDGALLVVARSNALVSLVDGATGQDAPPLEGLDAAECFGTGPPTYSVGNRLLAMCVFAMREASPTGLPGQTTVRVWDTRTGKLVQRWDGAAIVAFHPKRPVLAILERNGDQTRLGLWDFTQE